MLLWVFHHLEGNGFIVSHESGEALEAQAALI